ncbi:hypothetical protein USDA257_c20850 [Sinorhizobium fredii USDA 257]|uniref:Uncharacterized protein n=1 Tax=Sinorhizobium fredii (strain USDA 257) TaxID=1185652 RepID=I3X461_SINF2|nr:hypothetical protein USDA257_c20850 [Sinorhizobium fredii USDA 257]
MLHHGQDIPGIERDARLQKWRQTLGLRKHEAPLFQQIILVPVEIIDMGIPFTLWTSAGAVNPSMRLRSERARRRSPNERVRHVQRRRRGARCPC